MNIRVEYENHPLGIDLKKPHFSWEQGTLRQNYLQTSYRILVKDEEEKTVWDSEKTLSDRSSGILYEGEELKPCTRYRVDVLSEGEYTEDQDAEERIKAQDRGETWFETGLMCETIEGFEGAEWIGAPEKYLSSDRIGVFVLESDIQLMEGESAGIIFGAGDQRLTDPNRNIYGIAGENYICYELNVKEPALKIYRVGYAPEDQKDVPFSEIRLYPYEEQLTENFNTPLITDENRYDVHHLRIEVSGNGALTYLDDVLIDGEISGFAANMLLRGVEKKDIPEKLKAFGMSVYDIVSPRQLNPLGPNDVITFPRLNQVGYSVGEGSKAEFSPLTIRNLREPKHVITKVFTQGLCLEGKGEKKAVLKDPSKHSLPMFRTDFLLKEKAVKKARLYVTARGIYDVRLNGQAVTDTYLNPGLTQYDKRTNYQTYDVTGLLKKENGIGVLLASGWFTDAQTFTVKNYNYFGDREAFLLKLAVTYEDGDRDLVISNPETFTYYGEGPYIYAGNFQGETLDGRAYDEYLSYSLYGCELKSEGMPEELPMPEVIPENWPNGHNFGREWPEVNFSDMKLRGEYQAPVRAEEKIQAKEMFSPREGVYIYDLKQEIAGIPEIRFLGKTGERAVIRYGEMLYPDLPEYGDLCGTMLTENYRDAESTDYYILKGDPSGEVYSPKMTFHGFRYIEISGVEKAPEVSEVFGIQISSVKEILGKIETSDQVLNRLVENVRFSMLANFISIPTDCPQRNERMGWAGDTHIFARTATYLADMQTFYYRYLQALRDLQKDNGEMPMIAPVGGGFGGITYESAMILITWELYQQYGDTDVVKEFYPAMKKWMLHMEEIGMPGTADVGPINDWLAFDPTDNGIVWNAFYLRSADLMERFARILGKEEDAAYFRGRTELTRTYWNEHFLDEESGMMHAYDGSICDTQCAYALGLAYDCYYEKDKERAAGHLVRKIREADYTIRTGFFGTPILAPMLSAYGYTEDAYKLVLNRNFPSWLYPVTQGATTIWERWNSYTKENGFGGNNSMNSFNHYSYGAVLSWIVENMAGIQRDEKAPGYKHFTLKPEISTLENVTVSIPTPYGEIFSSWKKEEKGYCYTCVIPENTTATLDLSIEGGERINKELGSGKYIFHNVTRI